MPASSTITAAVFASGSGTNAENILRFAAGSGGRLNIAAVVCNVPGAGVIARAEKAGVPCHVIPLNRAAHATHAEAKSAQEKTVVDLMRALKVEWAFLAGYMQILSPVFLAHFADDALGVNRVVNIHPSLLPAFPGKDGYGDAWRAGVPQSGVTVHFVDGGVDTGPVIAQKTLDRLPGDTFESFKARGMALEYDIYTEFLDTLTREGPSRWARR